jgi:rhodanese-related sulfurtransferase
MAEVKAISREELKAKLDRGERVTILEILPEAAYRYAHLPGAINMPKDKVREWAPKLLPDKSAEIVTYCASVT